LDCEESKGQKEKNKRGLAGEIMHLSHEENKVVTAASNEL